jgi:type I restriction enzyme S subunit
MQYRLLGAHWYAEGLYVKDIKTGSEIQAKQLYRVSTADFVYNRLFAWKGAFAIAASDVDGCYVSNEFPCFRLKEARADGRFLKYYFSRDSVWSEALGLSSGGTPTSRNRLKEERLLAMSMPLPPIEEQRRIVGRIERISHKLQQALKLCHQSQQGNASVTAAVIESDCLEGRYPVVQLGDVLTDVKNGLYRPAEFWGRGMPCVRMYNIQGPGMNLSQIQSVEVTPSELEAYACLPGDLIFNRVNSAELVGKTGVVPISYPLCVFEAMNMRLRVDHKRIHPQYAAAILNSHRVRAYFRAKLKQQCGMASINQTTVRATEIPLPSLSQQTEIMEHLSSVGSRAKQIEALQEQNISELAALSRSVLNHAMLGEL